MSRKKTCIWIKPTNRYCGADTSSKNAFCDAHLPLAAAYTEQSTEDGESNRDDLHSINLPLDQYWRFGSAEGLQRLAQELTAELTALLDSAPNQETDFDAAQYEAAIQKIQQELKSRQLFSTSVL